MNTATTAALVRLLLVVALAPALVAPASAADIRLFTTGDTRFDGNLGGLAGADAKCNAAAAALGLGGHWVALLSTDTVDARDRIADGRYIRTNGVQVAANKAELFGSYPLDAEPRPRYTGWAATWTGSDSAGLNRTGFNCDNWTNNVSGTAVVGESYRSNSYWIERAWHNCYQTDALYCFETEPPPDVTVFVTHSRHDANFDGDPSLGGNGDGSGLQEADVFCNLEAAAAGLAGTYAAFLSTDSVDARDRIPDGQYVRPDGGVVAGSKADLLDGTLLSSANVGADGLVSTYGPTWTGTGSNGECSHSVSGTCDTCGNWTLSSGPRGTVGENYRTNVYWTERAWHSCDRTNGVYCFGVEPTSVCGDGVVESGEECDGGACCTPSCTYEPNTTECRAAVDVCDAPEFCTGLAEACPADDVEPPTKACRLSIDSECDPEELCDGVGTACPADVRDPDGSTCDDGDAATVGETCTAGLCSCLGPDLDLDLIPDVCDPEDAGITSLKKVVAWPTRSKPGRIKAKGRIQTGVLGPADVLDPSQGFTFRFTDALTMDESAAVVGADCSVSSSGKVKCRTGRNTVAVFKPTSTPDEYKFKIILKGLSFVAPQAGPITVVITQNADSLDRAATFSNCTVSAASLKCE